MRDPFSNPFPLEDEARHAIWTMLVPRDIDAFLARDWSMVEEDFIEDGFLGISGNKTLNPDHWTLAFPSLTAYRDEWLRQAEDFAQTTYTEDPRTAIFTATRLEEIDIQGETALVRKKFDGGIKRADGGFDTMQWQTLYYCRLHQGRWKISGFTGYLAYPVVP
ncbi:hypothetical protein NAC44_12840 [Allorhizobium sp. BGMRC 0089]|uniref:hypothetical protein n=1 Tax=Allorhizobium sonneratiae TaxID=2934936 RepID=UPI0020332866|nr:hypothetical protein [Allorhizobium sonneratiae]MCM2293210.1 hypothetical protein [Allorhizobium sonneratiae]